MNGQKGSRMLHRLIAFPGGPVTRGAYIDSGKAYTATL